MASKIIKFALDIGNYGIKLLVGEMSSKCDRISIIDYVTVNSKGIKKSNIEDPEALFTSIRDAVDMLSERISTPIDKVSIAIGGSGVLSSTRNIKISFNEREVTAEDIEELFKQAKKKILGTTEENNYRVLYKEIYNIRVNNTGLVKQPIGMMAKDLQADIHLVYIEESYVEKFVEIINRLGLEIEEIYLNSYVSAKGTLDDESRKMGVAHVDIGFASTDIILLKNYKVLYTKTISVGEMHYISDMIHMLGITKEAATEILNKFKRKEIENDNTIKFGAKKISLRDIRDIIQARTGDIIGFITSTIESSGFNGYLVKGIVLTGGAVAIDGVLEQITSKSGYLVRRKLPIEIKGLKNPFYSDAIVTGIFLEDMEKEYKKYLEEKEKQAKAMEEKEKLNSEELEDKQDKDDISNEENKKQKKSFWKRIKEFL